jgi:hypothetical protein
VHLCPYMCVCLCVHVCVCVCEREFCSTPASVKLLYAAILNAALFFSDTTTGLVAPVHAVVLSSNHMPRTHVTQDACVCVSVCVSVCVTNAHISWQSLFVYISTLRPV